LLKKRTVFVIGAGASKEFGLPVGTELVVAISDKLNVKFDEWGQKIVSGDRDLFQNVAKGRNATATQQAAWLIRDGIILANSIDDFLDVHRHDAEVVRYGKAAIVKCILETERSSKLYYDQSQRQDTTIDFRGCADTWLVKLMRRLGSQLSHSDRAKIFDKCSFVIFNYDRCVEHFFINALQRFYNIGGNEAQQIVASANIYHAYGATGQLDLPQHRFTELAFVPWDQQFSNQSRCPKASRWPRFAMPHTTSQRWQAAMQALRESCSGQRLLWADLGLYLCIGNVGCEQ